MAAAAGTMAGGCSNSASNILTTGALFDTKTATPAQAPAAAVVEQPSDRAIHAGAVSARALKCGYVFDPVKLQANFLASEAQRGTQPAELENLKRIYNYTSTKVASAVAGKDDYCTTTQTNQIKGDLNRQLAGNFSAPQAKKVATGSGWFDVGEPASSGQEKLNPEWVNNPRTEPRTIPVEPQ